MNKYNKWYKNITDNARGRVLKTYTEKHHVIPKSLGGVDNYENLVYLTAREHFICHWLLTKIYTGKDYHKMLNALRMMRAENVNQQRYKTKITARVYENLKVEWSELQSKRYSGVGNPMFGEKFHRSEDGKRRQANRISGDKNGAKQIRARKKISESKLGKKRPPFSKEWLEKLAESNRGENNAMFGRTHRDESKRKMSEKAKGRKQSAETIAKKAAKLRGQKREKKYCPHCERMIAVGWYNRHGDNCKQK